MMAETISTALTRLRQRLAAAGLTTDTGEAIASYLTMIEWQLTL